MDTESEHIAAPPSPSTEEDTYRPTKSGRPPHKASTKKQAAIRLLRRAQGASREELEQHLGWQAHSVRGFLSATARKLEGFELTRFKTAAGHHRYRLVVREGRA
jgi:hypothetical protein